jgi:beta-glucanase (GH16 family)
MSGGHWEYIQYRFTDIAEDILLLIANNGKPKTSEELKEETWKDADWYEKYPEDKFHFKYSDEHIEAFKKAYKSIREAQIYMQRLDWMLSGDDSEESFLKRLNEDLKKLDDELI